MGRGALVKQQKHFRTARMIVQTSESVLRFSFHALTSIFPIYTDGPVNKHCLSGVLFHLKQTAGTANLTRQRTEAEDCRRNGAGACAGTAGQCPADPPFPCSDLQPTIFLQTCEIHIRAFLRKKRMHADGAGLVLTDSFRTAVKSTVWGTPNQKLQDCC